MSAVQAGARSVSEPASSTAAEQVQPRETGRTQRDFGVVVCTRNRAEQLSKTLDALQRQRPANFRIVVVDQSDETDIGLMARAAIDSRLTVIQDSGRGLSRSRNIGWRAMDTEWIAYFDDDCSALEGWATAFAQAVREHPEASFIVGNVEGTNSAPGRINVSIFHVERERVISGRWVRPREIGFGVNFAVRRSAIEELDGWDERLGVGTSIPAGEDLDFNYRLLRSGKTAFVTPEIRSWHRQWREEKDVAPLLGDYMVGKCAFAIKHLRTGDILGGLLNWIGGVNFILYGLKCAVRERSMLRVRICAHQTWGLVIGTRKAMTQTW
jgi:glycosyltransferase involved in cell wall biosynthesis